MQFVCGFLPFVLHFVYINNTPVGNLTEMNMTHPNTRNIAVDAVIHFRTDSMQHFNPCHALSVSSDSVHILLDQPLNNQAHVTFRVRPEGAGQQPYSVTGEVKKRGLQDGGWLHEVTASSNRPWSPMFQYDVLCSTCDVLPELEDNTTPEHALEQTWSDLVAWEQAQPPLMQTQIAA